MRKTTLLLLFPAFMQVGHALPEKRFVNLELLIPSLEKKYDARIGLAIHDFVQQASYQYRALERFKLASIVKLFQAIHTLHMAEKGKLDLDTLIEIRPDMISPGSGKIEYFVVHPGFKISYRNLLNAMLTLSETTASDIFFEKTGGPGALNAYLQKNHLEGIQVSRTLREIFIETRGYKQIPPPGKRNSEWWETRWNEIKKDKKLVERLNTMFHEDMRDTATPQGGLDILLQLEHGRLLKSETLQYLIQMMRRCATGNNRMRLGFPPESIIANKTGSWNNDHYEYMADAGYVGFGKRRLAYAVFIETKLPERHRPGLFSEDAFVALALAISRDLALDRPQP